MPDFIIIYYIIGLLSSENSKSGESSESSENSESGESGVFVKSETLQDKARTRIRVIFLHSIRLISGLRKAAILILIARWLGGHIGQ